MRTRWIDKRYDHLDSSGTPEKTFRPTEEEKKTEADPLYHYDKEELCTLSTWEAMVQVGELSQEAYNELSKQPWLEIEMHEYTGEGLSAQLEGERC